MNMIQFAVASMVDANTGNGHAQSNGQKKSVQMKHKGGKYRSKSTTSLYVAIKSGIAAFIFK